MQKKNFIAINEIYKIGALLFLLGFFSSCEEKKPKTTDECIAEANHILKTISEKSYSKELSFLKKYDTFKDYTETDYVNSYETLHGLLDTVNFEININSSTSTESYKGIDVITYFVIDYFYISADVKKEICSFRYSKIDNNKYYKLSFFKDDLKPKQLPVQPKW